MPHALWDLNVFPGFASDRNVFVLAPMQLSADVESWVVQALDLVSALDLVTLVQMLSEFHLAFEHASAASLVL